MNRRNTSGFSLLELMTVMIIVVILGAISVPSYMQYLRKSKITEAYGVLDVMDKSQILYHTQYGSFVSLVSSNQTVPFENGEPIAFNGAGKYDQMKAVGFPVAEGSKTLFMYNSQAGKTDGTGTYYEGGVAINGPAALTHFQLPDSSVAYLKGANTICSRSAADRDGKIRPDQLGIQATVHEQYDWVVLSATANLNTSDKACTTVMKITQIMASSSSTTGYARSPLLHFSMAK